MNINKISNGMVFKNYKEFCKFMNIKETTGASKISQFKELERFCEYHKEGQKIIIDKKYDIPKNKKDKRFKYQGIITDKETKDEFDGFYVYAHYINNEVVYIGKGCKRRAIDGLNRKYKIEDLTNIKILKRFKSEDEALKYEEYMIDFYQFIGQCKYNDKIYHKGNKRNKIKER